MALIFRPLSPNLLQAAASLLSYEFMRNAFLAGGSIALAAGLVGYFVVLRNEVFTSDALGHVAFTGGLAGVLAGLALVPAVFVTTVLGSVAMAALGGRARGRDVAIGTLFAWVLGLGALLLSLYTTSRSAGTGNLGVSILFGSILTLPAAQAGAATAAGLGASAGLLAICRPLLFASIDPEVAAAQAVPVRLVTLAFAVLVGLTVAEAVQAVGALLIFGLLVTPAATAHTVTSNPYRGIAVSAGLAVLFVWLGTALAFYLPLPPSFLIIATSFATYLAAALATRATRGRR